MAQNNYILNFEGMNTYNDNKALVKSTGEVYRVKNKYVKYTVEITLNFDDSNKSLTDIMDSYKSEVNFDFENIPDIKISDYTINKDECNKNIFYLLENGSSYNECDLIVGTDNIRNSKLKDLLNGVQ